MKKIVVLLFVAVMFATLAACSAPAGLTQTLTVVPTELQTLIAALLTAGLTWLVLQIKAIDLSSYVPAVVAAISPILITLIQGWLGLIPTVYDDLVLAVIHMIVVGLGSLGALLFVKRKVRQSLTG
jgi:hypothetical protein